MGLGIVVNFFFRELCKRINETNKINGTEARRSNKNMAFYDEAILMLPVSFLFTHNNN